ncbi:sulfatase [Bacteroidota bacterium]
MRIVIRSILWCSMFFAFGTGCKNNEIQSEAQIKPNIIWLVAEDQSPDFFPMYGDSTIALPNIESLSSDGVVFTNAYTPVPVCAPTRSAIITGMYPTTLGTHNMRTYNAYSKENQPSIGIPSYSPLVPDGVKMFTEYLRKEGYYCTNNAKEDYNFKAPESGWDESSSTAHWRNRPKGAPFFSVFNFNVCHESGIWKQGEEELFVSPDSITVPPYFPDNDVIRHDLAVNYSNLKRLDEQLGAIINQLKEDGLYENSIIFFYGDHGGPFPRHKRALYDTGIKLPLVIKFQDNLKKSNYDDQILSFIDFAPTLLSWAGINPPKVMQGKARFGVYKDSTASKYVFATSDRFDEMYDKLRAVRTKRFKYIRNYNTDISNAMAVKYREQMPMMQNMMSLQASGKLDSLASLWFRIPKPEEELYDTQNDPYELVNLSDQTQWQDTLVHLRTVLNTWIKETNDLGRYPEKDLMEMWFPNGEPPKLEPLQMVEKGEKINLISKKSDATIIWKQPGDVSWHIFSQPLDKKASFIAKAVRIGYTDSDDLLYTID